MKKSFSKRIRVTGKGKLMRRKMAQSHFRAKKSGRQIRGKRKGLLLSKADDKVFRKYL